MRNIFILFLCTAYALSAELETVAQWGLLDYNFPYSDYRFIDNFRPERTVLTGFEVTNNRIFLAMPRIYAGVPATVATIPRNTPPGSSPILQAYPDWSFHEAGTGANRTSCNGLTSVYRMRIDSCKRLWVLDAGVLTSLENFRRICPPKILIFDLQTDQVLRTVIFPDEVLRPASLLTNLVIDESVQGSCDSSFVYISDTVAPGLIVYDSLRDRAWRVMHPSMFPDPDFGDSTVDGETVTLMDGIIGLTHSPNLATLYFQPYATNRIFSVPTSALRKGPPGEFEALPVSLVGTKSSQGVALAVNQKDDSLFFSPVTETSLASWNPVNNDQRLVVYDPRSLQFVADIRWSDEQGDLWFISSRFHKFFRRTVNAADANIRVMRISDTPKTTPRFGNSIYFK